MTQRGVKWFLGAYFLVVFGAVFLRFDYFPLSWVPMYGQHTAATERTFSIGDLQRRKLGFNAYRANGEQVFISASTLNIPRPNFRRLYMQRAFNSGPPQHRREREALMPFNRWWYETFIGPDTYGQSNYPAQLMRSINNTLGYSADDPLRIARFEAHITMAKFAQADLDRGDLSRPELRTAMAETSEAGTLLVVGTSRQLIAGVGLKQSSLYVDN